MASYLTTIEVNHDGCNSPEQSARALIAWIKEETGPIFVNVTNVDTGKEFHIQVL